MGKGKQAIGLIALALVLAVSGCTVDEDGTAIAPPVEPPETPLASMPPLPRGGEATRSHAAQGEDRPPASCSPPALEVSIALPLSPVGFRGSTAEVDEDLDIVALIDDPAGAGSLELPLQVRRDARGRWSLLAPVHPFDPFSDHDVPVRLRAGGAVCAEWSLRVLALEPAPGSLEGLYADADAILAHITRLLDLSEPFVMQSDASALPPPAQALRMLREAFDGEGHAGSTMTHLRAFRAEEQEDSVQVMEAIITRSGLADWARSLRMELELSASGHTVSTAPAKGPFMPLAMLGIADAKADSPRAGGGGFFRPDAETLDRWMSASRTAELARSDATTQLMMESTTALITVAGMTASIASRTGVRQAGAFELWFSALGGVMLTLDLGSELVEHLLPSRFVDMELVLDRPSYLEDDDDLAGAWKLARVTARSKEWDATKATAQLILSLTASRLGDAMESIIGDPYLQNMIGAMSDLLAGPWLDANLPAMQDNLGSIRFAARDFGPTDVSDERWSERSHRSLTGDEVIRFAGHQAFEVVGTGRAEVLVSTREGRFGHRRIERAQTVEVSVLDVRLDPVGATVEPGGAVELAATVELANYDGLEWSVQPAGAHRLEILPRTDGGPQRARLHTSFDTSMFPARVRAHSTSRTGLRRSGTPPRQALASIRAGGLEIEPRRDCIEPGARENFIAYRSSETTRQRVEEASWDSARGRIDPGGGYTAPATPGIDRIDVHDPDDHSRTAGIDILVASDCACRWSLTGGFGTYVGDSASFSSTTGMFNLGSDSSETAPLVMVGTGPIDSPGSITLRAETDNRNLVVQFPAAPYHSWANLEGVVEILELHPDSIAGRYSGRMLRAWLPPEHQEATEASLEFRVRRNPDMSLFPGIWVCGPSED